MCFFIFSQPKFRLAGNIVLPGSTYPLHGFSGRLVARSTSVKKSLLTYSRHSMQFLTAARNRVKGTHKMFWILLTGLQTIKNARYHSLLLLLLSFACFLEFSPFTSFE
jgi:hypothetical protein